MNCKKILASSLAIAISLSVCSSTVLAWSNDTWKKVVDNGSGQGTGHKSMIQKISANLFSSPKGRANGDTDVKNHRNIVAEAAFLTDELKNMKSSAKINGIDSPYHAKTIYSLNTVTNQHAKFLYELARRSLVYGKRLELNSSKYKNGTYHGVTLDLKIQKRIIDDLKVLNNKLGEKYDMSNIDHQGYMVLGVYFHLLEDIYCHKAKFTQEMVSEIDPNHIKDGDTLDNIGSAGIPIPRLNDHLKADGLSVSYKIGTKTYKIDSPCKPNQAYEDNPFFWPSRYKAAFRATKEQLGAIMNGEDFTFNTYDVPLFEAGGNDSLNGGDNLTE